MNHLNVTTTINDYEINKVTVLTKADVLPVLSQNIL